MKFAIIFTVIYGLTTGFCQVTNNEIANRIVLNLNGEWVSSTTAHSSVEWNCVNKVLTKKCLVYHNDQWLTFQVSNPGRYFLNIRNQNCLDKRGIQLLILEGNPCETKTYVLLKCISKVIQEDTYLVLDSLKGDMPYLVNIDGFLGDYCSFDLQISTRPVGLPFEIKSTERVEAEVTSTEKVVTISWNINKNLSDTLSEFVIYRKYSDDPRQLHRYVLFDRENAYGIIQLQYKIFDTLSLPGVYQYQIFGIEHTGELILIRQQQVNLLNQTNHLKQEGNILYQIDFPVKFKRGELIHIEIDDGITGKRLSTESIILPYNQKVLPVDFTEAITAGSTVFRILIYNEKRMKNKVYYYELTKSKELRQQNFR